MSTPRRIFGRTSLALAAVAVLSPVVGFLVLRHDWAVHDMSLELMAESFVVTVAAVVIAGVCALAALIAGGVALVRGEPDRWTGGVGVALGGLGVALVLSVAALVYSATGKGPTATPPVDAPAGATVQE